MKDLTPTSYTSPRTGTVYTVIPTSQSRVDYREYMNPATKYTREYIQYDIYFAGRKVQFAFSPEGVADSVAHFEGVSDGWTSSPRD